MGITFSAPARAIAATAATAALVAGSAGVAVANDTAVPGQQDREGVVTGHYKQQAGGCNYVVNYRGDFGGDAYLDTGWVSNQINCGKDGKYSYLIVHETDPRYTGDAARATWGGTWEVVKETWSGTGNVANPMHPEYAY